MRRRLVSREFPYTSTSNALSKVYIHAWQGAESTVFDKYSLESYHERRLIALESPRRRFYSRIFGSEPVVRREMVLSMNFSTIPQILGVLGIYDTSVIRSIELACWARTGIIANFICAPLPP